MSYFSPSGAGGVVVSSVVQPSGTVISLYAEQTGVAINATQVLIRYTVPPTKSHYPVRLDLSGTNIATYDILVGGLQWARYRTYFGGEFSRSISLGTSLQDASKIVGGTQITIQVTNFRPTLGNFEARLQYIEV